MAAKLSDVAKEAGCSVTTVSRVINNHGYLSQKTKDKVFAAMRKLNYQPNSVARSLQGKRMNLVGLIFPGIINPFFCGTSAKHRRRIIQKRLQSYHVQRWS